MTKKNILFLTPRFPFPLIGGDRLKPYNLMKHLAKKHNVTLISFYIDLPIKQAYLKEIEALGVELIAIPLYVPKAVFRTGMRLFGHRPLEIDFFTQPEFRKAVNEQLQKKKFDIGISFFMRTAEYLKDMDNIKKILIAEDCRVLYQNRSYKESKNIKQKLVRIWEVFKLKKYEPNIVNKFDITTLVTYEDINAMKRQNDTAQYRLLTNGTDIDSFIPPEDFSQRSGILFTGKLDVWSNIMMVFNIVEKVMPRIREKYPKIQLNIVGARPPASILALEDKYTKIHSNVPRFQPYLQNARVFLHPHSAATGIQNKLLEAMSCGCPVVTTPTGNQGIYAKHREHALIGEEYDQLADYTIELLENDELAKELSANARQLIVDTHSWQEVGREIDSIIEELFDE